MNQFCVFFRNEKRLFGCWVSDEGVGVFTGQKHVHAIQKRQKLQTMIGRSLADYRSKFNIKVRVG